MFKIKIIKIPEKPKEALRGDNKHNAWIKEIKKILGIYRINYDCIIPDDIIKINGIIYARIYALSNLFIKYNDKQKSKFDIICECGCNQFTITYDDYICMGRCVNCKKTEIIYEE